MKKFTFKKNKIYIKNNINFLKLYLNKYTMGSCLLKSNKIYSHKLY